jgi:alpha-galactosidase
MRNFIGPGDRGVSPMRGMGILPMISGASRCPRAGRPRHFQNRIAALTLALLAICSMQARPLVDLAKSPPMGWNSWNWHGKAAINEKIVEETIDAMVATGLRDAGYVYVVVDGGWRDTKLNAKGELLSHPTKFPGGMKRLADYAHARGMKFGVHTSPGTQDCGGDWIGAYGHEEVQLRQFVDWGLDFLKLDKCRYEPGWTEPKVKELYTKWAHLLANSGREIVFSISAYEFRDWYPEVCHLARTTYDIAAHIHKTRAIFDDDIPRDNFLSVMQVVEINNRAAAAGGNGYWNDAEMMVTGNQGLTPDEQRAHFALWCIMSAPLILGNDPRNMDQVEKDIVLNREAIAVNLDPTEQGKRVRSEGKTEIWVKRLAGNRAAVLLLNRDPKETQPVTLRASDLGPGGGTKPKIRDVFAKKDLGAFDGTLTKSTPPHAGWFLLVSGL